MTKRDDETNVVNFDQARQARQSAKAGDIPLRELDDDEMRMMQALLAKLASLRAEEAEIQRMCDLIEAGGDELNDAAYLEIDDMCEQIEKEIDVDNHPLYDE